MIKIKHAGNRYYVKFHEILNKNKLAISGLAHLSYIVKSLPSSYFFIGKIFADTSSQNNDFYKHNFDRISSKD